MLLMKIEFLSVYFLLGHSEIKRKILKEL